MQRTQPESARQGARQDGIDEIDPNLAGAGIRVGIVMARFNLNIGEGLLSACTDELLQLGVAAATSASSPCRARWKFRSYCRRWQTAASTMRWWRWAR